MIEATTHTAIRNGMAAAHDARGAAFRDLILALFGRRKEKGPRREGRGPIMQRCNA